MKRKRCHPLFGCLSRESARIIDYSDRRSAPPSVRNQRRRRIRVRPRRCCSMLLLHSNPGFLDKVRVPRVGHSIRTQGSFKFRLRKTEIAEGLQELILPLGRFS
jgi:hypothetical protein